MESSRVSAANRIVRAVEWSNGGDDPMLISSTDGLSQPPEAATHLPDGRELRRAVLRSVAYSDIFDYPLTAGEVHRYLAGMRTERSAVESLLANGTMIPHSLSRRDGYLTLPGRESLIEIRRKRVARSTELWHHAKRYGRVIADLPFVRMVAITGELAVNNVRGRSDIDYFIVTEPGRLWLTRAMVILVVKAAARQGIVICPNYLVTEDALSIDVRNLYTAREIAQMIPLSGMDVYHRMRRANAWVLDYLPNASGAPARAGSPPVKRRRQRFAEALLRTPVGTHLETWEMTRKIRKFTREAPDAGEVAFAADWCKGHFDAHGAQTLNAYAERLQLVEELMQ